MTTRKTVTDFSKAVNLAREEPRTNTLHQKPQGAVFPCGDCRKTFASPSYLERHQNTCNIRDSPRLAMEGDKVYGCPCCKYYTTHRGAFRRHLLTHTGEKPYKCDVCGKGFSEASYLTTHRRIHTGDKPYKCAECPYRSSSRQYLKRHMSSKHTGRGYV